MRIFKEIGSLAVVTAGLFACTSAAVQAPQRPAAKTDRLPIPGPFVDDPTVARLFTKVRASGNEPINIHQAMAYVPATIEQVFALTGALRTSSGLRRDDQELIILRTAIVANGVYEIPPHRLIARNVGLSAAQIDQVAHWEKSRAYSDRQRAILKFIDQSLSKTGVANDVFDRASKYLSKQQLVAATLLSGAYAMLSQVTRSFEVPIDKLTDDQRAAMARRLEAVPPATPKP